LSLTPRLAKKGRFAKVSLNLLRKDQKYETVRRKNQGDT